MIEFRVGDTMINVQAIRLYGVFIGVIYYDPNLEPDSEPVDEDEFYQQVTIALFFFGFHFNIWKL